MIEVASAEATAVAGSDKLFVNGHIMFSCQDLQT